MDDYDYFPVRYEAPTRLNLHYDSWLRVPPFFYHLIAGLFWLALRAWAEMKVETKPETYGWRWTRKLANQKTRTHGKYFEDETAVTDFKHELDKDD